MWGARPASAERGTRTKTHAQRRACNLVKDLRFRAPLFNQIFKGPYLARQVLSGANGQRRGVVEPLAGTEGNGVWVRQKRPACPQMRTITNEGQYNFLKTDVICPSRDIDQEWFRFQGCVLVNGAIKDAGQIVRAGPSTWPPNPIAAYCWDNVGD